MIRLDATTRKLQVILAGAVTTNQLPVTVCYSDKTLTTYVGGTQVAVTNGGTAVDICAAPAASTVRDIDSIDLQNADTAVAVVTIRYNDNATLYTLFKSTLAVGDQVTYTHGRGWQVLDSTGAAKGASGGGTGDMILAAAQTVTGAKTFLDTTFLLRNVANTFSGIFTNTVTAVRTWAWPDKSGTVAMTSDVEPAVQDFRLTLTTGVPITTSDVTGATTIYCCPYKGSSIGLYDGSVWNIRTSAQFSLALGTLTSALCYDVFCYDNAGTPTLEFLAWTSATARATPLVYQNGILVKSGALTRRYLGTFFTTSTTATEDSIANRYLWNYYNRTPRYLYATDATASWTYQTLTFRQANNSSVNQVNFVSGLAEDLVRVQRTCKVANSAGANMYSAVAVDSITTFTVLQALNLPVNISTFLYPEYSATYLGKHYVAALEMSEASGTTTWTGVNASDLKGMILA